MIANVIQAYRGTHINVLCNEVHNTSIRYTLRRIRSTLTYVSGTMKIMMSWNENSRTSVRETCMHRNPVRTYVEICSHERKYLKETVGMHAITRKQDLHQECIAAT